MIQALKLVHSQNICHGNISLETFRVNFAGEIKLTNFDYS